MFNGSLCDYLYDIWFDEAFKKVDILLAPTAPTTAFGFGDNIDNPMAMYLSDLLTIPANLAGLPAMSLPNGFSKNLPIGAQFVGNYFSEELLLNTAHKMQEVTDWHKMTP